MSVKSFVDAVYAYRLVMLMGKPFTSWTAYKLGLIDAKGNILRAPESPREFANFTKFHSIIRTVKQTVATYTSSVGPMYLAIKSAWTALKEDYHVELDDIRGNMLAEGIQDSDIDRFIKIIEIFEMTAGDAGGDAIAIATGANSGDVTNIGPSDRVKSKPIAKKKPKATH